MHGYGGYFLVSEADSPPLAGLARYAEMLPAWPLPLRVGRPGFWVHIFQKVFEGAVSFRGCGGGLAQPWESLPSESL